MPQGLPPTPSLRAFECVARLGSFKRAAEELHISPSALSRQIQALERHLGHALFRRLNPGLEITEEGRRYLEVVARVLGELEAAQRHLAHRIPLRISALQSFTEHWLMPNLADFERAHPEVEVEIEATFRYADFAREAVDAAIRFGTGPWDDLFNEPLLELEAFPVCSPRLAAGVRPLRVPADLAQQTLIHVVHTPDAWPGWLRAAGVPDLVPRREVRYDHVGITLSAAEAGQGVALSTDLHCASRLRAGTLCRPLPQRWASPETYHFVCRSEQVEEPRIAAFRTWLRERLAANAPGASALAK